MSLALFQEHLKDYHFILSAQLSNKVTIYFCFVFFPTEDTEKTGGKLEPYEVHKASHILTMSANEFTEGKERKLTFTRYGLICTQLLREAKYVI